MVLVVVGHAVADGALRRVAPDVARQPEGRIPGAVRRSGIRRVRHGAGACAVRDRLVATLEARSRGTLAGRPHGRCRCCRWPAITGAFALWWGGSAPPGRELVAALPLLGVPIAWLWKDTAARPAQRAVIETLILLGIVITATFVLARHGLLIANDRDGTAELLEYLEPRGELAAGLPSFIAFRSQVAVPLAVSAIWITIAAAVWRLCRLITLETPGSVRLLVAAIGVGGCAVAATLAPAIVGARSMPALPVEARVETPSLSGYDATSRPLALEFSPWRMTTPADAIRAIRFDATPGLRRSAQPVRVLLNARLALPAGTYRIRIDPAAGETLAGDIALQVGRTGPPAMSWPVNVAAGRLVVGEPLHSTSTPASSASERATISNVAWDGSRSRPSRSSAKAIAFAGRPCSRPHGMARRPCTFTMTTPTSKRTASGCAA